MQYGRKANIGCGIKPTPGAVNIDILPLPGVDIVCDITKEMPLRDGDFNEVIAEYVLCQIHDPKKFMFVMNEVWRVLRPGGIFKIKVPNAKFPCAFQDPLDCRYFVKETFDYFNEDHYRYTAFQYGFKPWEIVKIEEIGRTEDSETKDRFYVELRKPTND